MLTIPKDLIDTLHDLRAKQLQSPFPNVFVSNHPAVIFTLGLGDEFYLTFDGRVMMRAFLDEVGPILETTDLRLIGCALRICARSYDLPELMTLVAVQGEVEKDCSGCDGEGIVEFGFAGPQDWIVCPQCSGLGWQRPP